MGQGEMTDLLSEYQSRPKDFGSYAKSLGYAEEQTDDGVRYAKDGFDGREFLEGNPYESAQQDFAKLSTPEHWMSKASDGRAMTYEPGMTLDSATSPEYQKLGMGTVRDALKRYDPGFNESNWYGANTEQNPFDKPAYLRSEKYDYGKEAPYTDASGIPLPLLIMAALMTGGAAMGAGAGAAGLGAAGAGGVGASTAELFGALGAAGSGTGLLSAEALAGLGMGGAAAGGVGASTGELFSALGAAGSETGTLSAEALSGILGEGASGTTVADLNKIINPQFNEIGQSTFQQNLAPQFPGAQTPINGGAMGMSTVDALMAGLPSGFGATGLGTGLANGLTLPPTPPSLSMKNLMDIGKAGSSLMNQGQQQQQQARPQGQGGQGQNPFLPNPSSYMAMSPFQYSGPFAPTPTAMMMPRRRYG